MSIFIIKKIRFPFLFPLLYGARLCYTGAMLKKLLALATVLFLSLAAFVFALNLFIVLSTRRYIYTNPADMPERYTAIVLGAKVYGVRTVSHVFRDRIEGGLTLLDDGTVQRVIISGDHGKQDYDEVNAARLYVSQMHHVDESLIFYDHAGFSTYDTMYRARDVFCVQDAVVVTQRFHLYRSLFIARSLGIDAVGYAAPEINRFRRMLHVRWECRECLARVKAFFSVVLHAKPSYLGEQIPITGDGRSTWD